MSFSEIGLLPFVNVKRLTAKVPRGQSFKEKWLLIILQMGRKNHPAVTRNYFIFTGNKFLGLLFWISPNFHQ